MIYLDTSALIKLYVAEQGSAEVIALVRREGIPATATIAYAEVYSGLMRRRREGSLTVSQYAHLSGQFEQDWTTYVRVELQKNVLDLARDLLQRYALRAFDAVHAASALSLKTQLKENFALVAADGRLLRAAEAEGLIIVNVGTVQDS